MIPRRAPCCGEGGFRGTGAPRDRSQPVAATLFRRVAGGKAPSVRSPKISLPCPPCLRGELQAQHRAGSGRPSARRGLVSATASRRYRGGVLSGRALALALLFWSLVRVLARLLFTKQPPGIQQFHDHYGSEGLSAIDKSEREALASFSRCIACARCDFGEAERIAASDGQYPGLMQLGLASSRSMPDFDAAARGFDYVPESVLRRKVRRCPVAIPFPSLAEFVRAKAPKSC